MTQSSLRLIKRCAEYLEGDQVLKLPRGLRGIYVLYKRRLHKGGYSFDVVYVGMASKGGIRSRLKSHRRKKAGLWTHFSIFEVWENIRDDEVRELEGLFRHLYRDDSKASPLNLARGYKALRRLRSNAVEQW
ncbi:MAG: GIY-YIG nuclease family protein [Gemmatimonadaceae bacterium]